MQLKTIKNPQPRKHKIKGVIDMKFAIMGTGVMGCGWITQCAASGKGFYDWSDPRHPRSRKLAEYIIGTAEDMTDRMK
jgi:hypothetical protein